MCSLSAGTNRLAMEIAQARRRPPLQHESLERGHATSFATGLAFRVGTPLPSRVGGSLSLRACPFGCLLPEHLTLRETGSSAFLHQLSAA